VLCNGPSLTHEVCGQPGPLRQPAWLETLRHEHACTYWASCPLPSCRICAMVQKVKIRRLGRSPEVADLAGIRNLRNTVKAELWLVPRLQSMNQPGYSFKPSKTSWTVRAL
jgi:hypothetical protein